MEFYITLFRGYSPIKYVTKYWKTSNYFCDAEKNKWMDRKILVAACEIDSSNTFALPCAWGKPIPLIVETGAIK